jgi:hypothetical protein
VTSRSKLVGLVAGTVILLAGAVALVITRSGGEQEYEADGVILESAAHGPELCLSGVLESLPPQCSGPPITNWDWNNLDGEESRQGTSWISAHVRGTYDGERFTLRASPGPFQSRDDDSDRTRFLPACDDPSVVDPSEDGDDWVAMSQGEKGGPYDDPPQMIAAWMSEPREGVYDGPFVGNYIVKPGYQDAATEHVRKYYKGHLCIVERDQPLASELMEIQSQLPDLFGNDLLTASSNERRGVVEAFIILADDEAKQRVDEKFGEGLVELTGALKPV